MRRQNGGLGLNAYGITFEDLHFKVEMISRDAIKQGQKSTAPTVSQRCLPNEAIADEDRSSAPD